MHIQKGIKFLLHKRHKSHRQNLAIRMRVTLKGERPFDFPLGRKVDLDKWNAEEERVVADAIDATEINRTIEEYKSLINEVFARYELLEKRVPTPQEVKDLFNDMTGRISIAEEQAKEIDFWHVFDLFIRQSGEKNQWQDTTFSKFRAFKKHLITYNPQLSFGTLCEEQMQGFIRYLLDNEFKNITISKYLGLLRWFLRWARQRDYYRGDLHETFKPKLKGVSVDSKEIIFLSRKELQMLWRTRFMPAQQPLERVRDVFLFQCFTGLRYSDVAKLRRADLKDGFIHVVTQKTSEGLRIELNKHSQAILDKYKDCIFPADKLLPIVSNENMNARLKIIGQMAGIDEPTRIVYFKGNQRHEEVYPKWYLLTTHVARRTFVVTALQLGIPAEVIMRWTGHSNFEAMKPYVKIVDELKEKSMSKFDNL